MVTVQEANDIARRLDAAVNAAADRATVLAAALVLDDVDNDPSDPPFALVVVERDPSDSWSAWCRDEDHRWCRQLRADCACPCHGSRR